MGVRAGYKQTEAGLLPTDWDATNLGPLVRITSGASPSMFRFSGNGIPYFKVEQLSNSEKYLSAAHTPYHFERGPSVPAKSVVFAKRGAAIALNKLRILNDESFMDTNLMALTPEAVLDAEYLFYALGHIGLWRFADTTSVPQINNKHVKPLVFPMPTVDEQRAIAGALSDVDSLLDGLDRLIAKKRDLKRATMQQLLTGQTRLPGFIGEWAKRRLGHVADFSAGTYLAQALYKDGHYDVQGAGGPMGRHDKPNIAKPLSVIGRVGTIGKPRFYAAGCWVNNNAAAVVARSDSAPEYVQLLLSSLDWSKVISVTAQPFLVVPDLMNVEFQIPEREEQAAIANVLSDMDAERSALEARRDKTKDLKKAMMQDLLTGKRRLVNGGARV